jgi:hypothetical protein
MEAYLEAIVGAIVAGGSSSMAAFHGHFEAIWPLG